MGAASKIAALAQRVSRHGEQLPRHAGWLSRMRRRREMLASTTTVTTWGNAEISGDGIGAPTPCT